MKPIVRRRAIRAALTVLLLAPLAAMADDWPNKMTSKQILGHTINHDGYVVRPIRSEVVRQDSQLIRSRSTLDFLMGYSPKQGKWVRLTKNSGKQRYSWIGIRSTLRAVQSGGENWQLRATSSQDKHKLFSPVAYQKFMRGEQDCFGEYVRQDLFCRARTLQVLWFVESKCLSPGPWKFELQDSTNPGTAVAEISLTVPTISGVHDVSESCIPKPTPVTAHDSDGSEKDFRLHAQRELMFYNANSQLRAGPAIGTVTAAPVSPSDDERSLRIQLVSDGELLLTDSGGRKTGVDSGSEFQQIPGSVFLRAPAPENTKGADAKPLQFITVPQPTLRDYVVSVANTNSGHFLMTITGTQTGRSMTLFQSDVHVSTPVQYLVQIEPSDPRRLHVSGYFSGDDTRNHGLLTFASPIRAHSELPADSRQTEILIFYAAGIDPESMNATLNGADVRSSFHPYANWREAVQLPLAPGDNLLNLAIDGTVNGKPVAEKIELMFTVATADLQGRSHSPITFTKTRLFR